ncbi:MAG: hypothetical protein ACRD2E_07920 [Terriglobales bacterium]
MPGQPLSGAPDTRACWLSPDPGAPSAQRCVLGRDPAGVAAVNPANPQTSTPRRSAAPWGAPVRNAYAYLANQPLQATDPLGLDGGGGGQTIGGGNPLTPSAQCEAEGLPEDCWWNPQLDYLCGSGSPWEQLDPSCRQFATPAPSEGGGGIAPETVPITGKIQLAGPGCTEKILTDVNNQFGTSFSSGNVTNEFPQGGGADLQIEQSPFAGSVAQFNSIQPGRYPNHWWSYLIGWGPNLHVTGETPSDPRAVFSDQNVGGSLSVELAAHIDSAWAYNPVGLILHMMADAWHVFGQRNPCP